MKRNDHDARLDRAIAQIRDEKIDPALADAAAARVRERLSRGAGEAPVHETATLHGCESFSALIPAAVDGTIAPARLLLLEDHARDCRDCRARLLAARSGLPAPRPEPAGATRGAPAPAVRSRGRWGLLAAAVLIAAVAGVALWNGLMPGPTVGPAVVERMEGSLLTVEGETTRPLDTGGRVEMGVPIRTAKGSTAQLRLADGSLVEMRERSEFTLDRHRRGAEIRLARGGIIVQASEQGAGFLSVTTEDALVSVTGTVFSVKHGTKGSRVSVIEGEVEVASGASRRTLQPGDQYFTHPSLGPVPVESDFAWSRDIDSHLALMRELTELGREMDRTILSPSPRHSTRLLDMLPKETLVYAAIPNVSTNLARAHEIFQDRIRQSELLAQWWEAKSGSPDPDPHLETVIEKIRSFGDHLGDEVLLTLQADPSGTFRGALLLAELSGPAEFRDLLEREIPAAGVAVGKPLFRVVDAPTGEPLPPGREEVQIWIRGDILAVATHPSLLAELDAAAGDEARRLEGGSFHERIAEAYRDGAGWLFAVDMRRLIGIARAEGLGHEPEGLAALERAGFADIEHILLELREEEEGSRTEASIIFDQARRGLASWLAAPAPMGGLDFVSPDALMLSAFVVKDTESMLDDLLALLDAADPTAREHLERFESEEGIDLRNDVAAPLGGEIAFALDGPVLPTPSWKLVLEVYDPVRLQSTIEWLAGELADEGFRLTAEEAGGRTYHTLIPPDSPVQIHYLFTDGYLVAAPNRALLNRALQTRASGVSLAGSAKFRSLMPHDGGTDFSALFYQDLVSAIAPMAERLVGQQVELTPEQLSSIEAIAGEARPTFAYAYAGEDRILLASRDSSPFGSDLGALLGYTSLMDVRRMAEHAIQEHGREHETGH